MEEVIEGFQWVLIIYALWAGRENTQTCGHLLNIIRPGSVDKKGIE